MELSRRNFLRATGGISAGVFGLAEQLQQDEYDVLRNRWLAITCGNGYNPATFASQLNQQAQTASAWRIAMAPTTSSLWPDLPFGTVSGNVSTSYTRLLTMARAWGMPGTSSYGDATLRSAVLDGLDTVNTYGYTAGRATYGNWWDWQIGSPQRLFNTLAIVYDHVQVGSHLAAVDHYVPDSKVSSYTGVSTGANRSDMCQVLAMRGVLGKVPAKVALARDALAPIFPYVTTGDGFYVDGSFIQHTYLPYTGSYGSELIGGLSRLFALLAGSSWSVSSQIMLDNVERAYAPFLFNGLMMDGLSGRAPSRGINALDPLRLQHDDHRRGHGIINHILLLAEAASPSERSRWRGLAKGWLQRDYWSPYLSDASLGVEALARGKAVLDDSFVSAIAEPVHSKVFGSMDRAVHRRPQWALAISMCSARTTFYEHGNGENGRGWHTNNGMVYWWGATSGNGQYSDAFWPTVDPYRLPGVTVSRKPLADAAGPARGGLRPSNTWAGGASDGEFSAVGQYCRGAQSTLAAKKSWFCLDDAVVCLGSGISSTDGYAVESIVDNRNLGPGTGTHILLVNGIPQPVTMGWTAALSASWTHLNGFGGHVFPGGTTINALRHERVGRWSDINVNGATDELRRKYLTLWYDHGVNPTNGTYAYLMMPGATSAATQARAADSSWLTVHANTRYQHAIAVPSLGVSAFNFWEIPATPINQVSVDQPASVLIRQTGNTATVCLADARQNIGTITLTWQRPVAAVVSKDSTVTVLQTGTQLVLRFNTAGSAGRTHTAKVNLA